MLVEDWSDRSFQYVSHEAFLFELGYRFARFEQSLLQSTIHGSGVDCLRSDAEMLFNTVLGGVSSLNGQVDTERLEMAREAYRFTRRTLESMLFGNLHMTALQQLREDRSGLSAVPRSDRL